MAITRGIFPRYTLVLKAARNVSDESFPSSVRRHLARHSPYENVDFMCSEHLITSGNGYHTLHRSATKCADKLRLSVPQHKRKFKISAITAVIHETNTGVKVEPSRITPSRSRSSSRSSPRCSPHVDNLSLVTMATTPVISRALVPPGATFSCSILANPTSHPTSYAALLCSELHQSQVDIGKPLIPPRYDIMRNSHFGRPDIDHSFTSEACFEHNLIHLLKVDILSQSDSETLLSCHPLFLHLYTMLQ